LFNPAAPEIPLKHAPPVRRSHLEMAKLQIRAQLGQSALTRMHKAEPYATYSVTFSLVRQER
jgi:hypothetical protein